MGSLATETIPAASLLAAGDGEHLASVVAQLADAQAFLETNPVPVSRFAPCHLYKFCGSTAEVDVIAAAIGEPAGWTDDGKHYETERRFGNEVKYTAIYIIKHEEQEPPASGGQDDDEAGEDPA
jgi:hypothetical protein